MRSAIPRESQPQATFGARRAVVTEVLSPQRVRVAEGEALVAVPPPYLPRVGDEVLVLPAGAELYLIGVLCALREAEPARVCDAAGRVLFEHRAAEGKSVVYAPEGDLELRAEHGSVSLFAEDRVRFEARGGIEAQAPVARVALGHATLAAKTLTTVAETARHSYGVLETEAARILERAKAVYRDVEDLSQTRAGRMRLVARATFHLLGKRALFKAEEDVKIAGERIYLA